MKKLLKIIDTQIINLEYEAKSGYPYITEEEEDNLYDAIDMYWKIRKLITDTNKQIFTVAIPKINKVSICGLYNCADFICFKEYDGEYDNNLSKKEMIEITQKANFKTIEDPFEILNKLEKIIDDIINVDVHVIETTGGK